VPKSARAYLGAPVHPGQDAARDIGNELAWIEGRHALDPGCELVKCILGVDERHAAICRFEPEGAVHEGLVAVVDEAVQE
jgi:hypothetical protein